MCECVCDGDRADRDRADMADMADGDRAVCVCVCVCCAEKLIQTSTAQHYHYRCD